MASSLSVIINETLTTQWVVYSSIKNISTEAVDINQMELLFTSNITVESKNIWGANWVSATVSEETLSDKNIKTTITLNFSKSTLLQPGATIDVNFSVDRGPLNSPDDLKNLAAVAKSDPNAKGSLELHAPALPNPELQSLYPSIKIQGLDIAYDQTINLNWGEIKNIDHLFPGNYTVTPQSIETENAYYLPHPSSEVVTITDNAQQTFSWTLQEQDKAHVTFTLPPLPVSGIGDFDPVIVYARISNGKARQIERVQRVPLKFGQTSPSVTLIAGISYQLIFSTVTVNNVRYQPVTEDGNTIYNPKKGENQINLVLKQKPATYTFCPVNMTVQGVSGAVPIRLQMLDADNFYYYTTTDDTSVLQKIRLGSYSVDANVICQNNKPYKPDLSQTLVVQKASNQCANTSYVLTYKEAFSLLVKGWPNYLAHGGVTDGSLAIRQSYIDQGIPTNALFRYAGTGGDGDPNVILDDSVVEKQVSSMVADVQALKNSQGGRPVVGVFVIYTFQLSGGTNTVDVANPEYLKKHYINLLKYCLAAQKNAAQSSMSIVVNPDTLGMLQQQGNQLAIQALYDEGSIEVEDQLAKAFQYLGLDPDDIPEFANNINGYCQSINWIIRYLAPDVSFGWQENVWSTGSANWVIDKKAANYATAPEENADKVVSFINNIEVYKGDYKPDFIVFDKYERDDFGDTARQSSYAYVGEAWQRYLRYVSAVSQAISSPAMLWQIPGAHMPTKNEQTDMVIADHSGSGASFFMSDSRIGTDVDLTKDEMRALPLSTTAPYGANTVGALLNQDNNYNWGTSQLKNAMFKNVFAILWGGGQTTSIVSLPTASGTDTTWLPNKLKIYYENVIPLIGAIDCSTNGKKPEKENQCIC